MGSPVHQPLGRRGTRNRQQVVTPNDAPCVTYTEGRKPSEWSKEMDSEKNTDQQQERLLQNEWLEFLNYNNGEGWFRWLEIGNN